MSTQIPTVILDIIRKMAWQMETDEMLESVRQRRRMRILIRDFNHDLYNETMAINQEIMGYMEGAVYVLQNVQQALDETRDVFVYRWRNKKEWHFT